MARYTGAVCRLCRREGQKLFLKGDRCYSNKCSVAKRSYPPGQHGKFSRRRPSEYGLQLRAKQLARRYYGVMESQFAKYFDIAERRPGVTGENLLRILELRLDNIVYRLGYASSRPQARQFVRHGYFTVNGRRVNIPSYICKPSDIIAISEKFSKNEFFKAVQEANASRPVPAWLDKNNQTNEAKVLNQPNRDEIDLNVEETLIVELYSK